MPVSVRAWRIDCAAIFDPPNKETETMISPDPASLEIEGFATYTVL